jgi:hypothetical protein
MTFAVQERPVRIRVARDAEGLRIAARELFEEQFFANEDQRTLETAEKAANREAVLRSLPERRTLSPGYYIRARYLLDLELLFTIGIRFELSDLQPEEITGIRAVRSAQEEFERAHPACNKCGTRQKTAWGQKCDGCGVELQRRKAS